MQISVNKTSFLLIVSLFLFNLSLFLNTNNYFINKVYILLFILLIPGYLLLSILKVAFENIWSYFLYDLGLSIAYLMIGGLILNNTLLFFHVQKPLALMPISLFINITLIPLIIVLIINKNNLILNVKCNKSSIKFLCGILSPFLLLLFVISGSILLNNRIDNINTLIGLILISIVTFFITIRAHKINKNILLALISSLSIFVLFMVSLRGNSFFGSDILGENMVFETVRHNGFWINNNSLGGLYNLCLSITILPTILAVLSNTSNLIIYKLIFPLIFSFVPAIIFLISNKYFNRIISFLTAIFFLANPSFWNTLPAHEREGMSLFFFTLFILVLFSQKLSERVKFILLLIFGLSTIFSHYSTSFFMLVWLSIINLISFVYIIILKFQFPILKNHKYNFQRLVFLKSKSSVLLCILWIVFITWYTQVPSNLIESIKLTFDNLKYSFSSNNTNLKADRASLINELNVKYTSDPQSILLNTFNDIKYKAVPQYPIYPRNSYVNYKIEYIPPISVKPDLSITLTQYIFYIGEGIKRIGLLLMGIGMSLFIIIRKYRSKIDIGFTISSMIFAIIVVLSIVIPLISVEYDIGRVYIQALVFLSLPAMCGLYILFSKIKRIGIVMVSIFISLHFLIFTGGLYYAFGISNSPVQFSNSGEEYDSLFIHDQEIKSSGWLLKNSTDGLIYSDEYSNNVFKLHNQFPNILYYQLLIPSLIPKQSYVYLGYTNTIKNKAYVWVKSLTIGYNVPVYFLNNNKNLIYNNGGSKIYR